MVAEDEVAELLFPQADSLLKPNRNPSADLFLFSLRE